MSTLESKRIKKQLLKAQQLAREETLNRIITLKEKLWHASEKFENATEPELVEAVIYEIRSLQAEYAYYLRAAKEMGMSQSFPHAHSTGYRQNENEK